MTAPRPSVVLPDRAVGLAGLAARIRPWAGVSGTTWPSLLAVAAGMVAMGWIAALLVGRVDGLSAPPYDLAFFQQVIWNVGYKSQWLSSFHEGSFLGLHFSPILVVPALVERLVWADVRVLSVFHAVAIGALVPAAFLFLRAALRPSRAAGAIAAGLAIGIPLWGSMQDVIRSDFHPEVAGVGLALLAGWAGLSGRPRAMWAFAILALVTREDLAYAVGVIGLVVAARGRGNLRRHGRILALVAASWAVVVFSLLMPWLRDGAGSDTARYYAWLGGGLGVLAAPVTMTERVVAALTRPEPWFVVAGMTVSLLGLPLVRPRWGVLILPPLLALLLSSHRWQANVALQYSLILVVPLLVSAGLGGRRVIVAATRAQRRWRRRSIDDPARSVMRRGSTATVRRPSAHMGALLAGALFPAVAGAWIQGSLPPFDRSDPAFLERPASIDRLQRVASGIPVAAVLVADEGLVAPLADRAAIRSLIASAAPPRGAYVLVDREAWSSGPREAQRRGRILEVLRSSARPVLSDDGRFVLWGPQPGGGVP